MSIARGGAISLILAMIAALTFFTATEPASAQSSKCRALAAQLASTKSDAALRPSDRYKQYDRAARNQATQISMTRQAAKNFGCAEVKSSICNRISESLRRMKTNLSTLQAKRDKLAPSSSNNSKKRRSIQAEMRRRGCGKVEVRNASTEPKRRRKLLEQIFGAKTYSERSGRTVSINRTKKKRNSSRTRSGTFRTLCVRTCDGYYFPISFSTTKKHFATDLESCAQMCPGTQTALYIHDMPGGDAETSVSWSTGEPYSSLENAYSYRRAVNPECKCMPANRSTEETAGTWNEAVEARRNPSVSLPIWRQDRGLDPETHENRAGGLTLQGLAALNDRSSMKDDVFAAGEKPIRIVGPAFFPVQ